MEQHTSTTAGELTHATLKAVTLNILQWACIQVLLDGTLVQCSAKPRFSRLKASRARQPKKIQPYDVQYVNTAGLGPSLGESKQ